ncbi:MAG: superoxide dismutase family protein [Terriglobales bacterium]
MKSAFFLLLAVLATAVAWASPAKILVQLKNAQGKIVGSAILWETAEGAVEMEMSFRDLPPGEHAIHFHQNAKCDAPDFKSAGPHFNPDGKKHGLENPEATTRGITPTSPWARMGPRISSGRTRT